MYTINKMMWVQASVTGIFFFNLFFLSFPYILRMFSRLETNDNLISGHPNSSCNYNEFESLS